MTQFQQNILTIYPEKGKLWLTTLSSAIQQIALDWELTELKSIKNLSFNYILTGYQMNNILLQKQIQIISCLLVCVTQAGITFYLSSFPSIAQHLHAPAIYVSLTLVAYMLGYALPMLLWGALIDSVGRKRTLIIALSLFTVTSLAIAISKSIYLFIILRFMQGAAGGGCAITGRTLARDVFEGEGLAKAMAYISMAFVLALGVFQSVGGWIESNLRWQYDFIIMALFSLGMLIWIYHFLPEPKSEPQSTMSLASILSGYKGILGNNRFILLTLIGSCLYGFAVAFNVLSPFLFLHSLSLTPQHYGNLGFVICIGYLLGVITINHYLTKLGMTRFMFLGYIIVILAGIYLSVMHFLVINASIIMFAVALVTFAQALVYPCAMATALKYHKQNAGQATASFGFGQQLFGFTMASIAAYLPHTSTALTGIILSLGSIGILCLLNYQRHD